jgi:hypothetical protein
MPSPPCRHAYTDRWKPIGFAHAPARDERGMMEPPARRGTTAAEGAIDVTYPLLEAIGEAGVVASGEALAVRELARALRLEVEQALALRLPLGSTKNQQEQQRC